MTWSALTHLEGSLSGVHYPADVLARVDPLDGRPLLARYDLEAAGRTLSRQALVERRGGGLWRWRELLPVRDARFVIFLGEGDTPLLPVPRLGRALGSPGLSLKVEGGNPTGSFKARGMAVAVARAHELGATALLAPSAGNAGSALARYGTAAGLDVTVLMPVDSPPATQAEVLVTGAALILVEGLISDCGALGAALAGPLGAFDVSTLSEPYRVEGKKTMAFELAEQRGWRLPDVIVYPTGGGTGLVAMPKAFDELEALGLIGSARPRLVSVQAAGCAPIVRAFEAGERFARPWAGARTAAAGLRVPSAVGDFLVLDAVRASGGTAVAVDEAAIAELQGLGGRLGAGLLCPETAAALAALPELRGRGVVGSADEVVVFDCGSGLKYPPPSGLPQPPVVRPDADVETLLSALRSSAAGARGAATTG